MSVFADLEIRGFTEKMLPDAPKDLNSCLFFDDETVISRGYDGSVLSKAKDSIWNLSPYNAKGQCKINFVSWTKNKAGELFITIVRELKSVQFVRLYLYPKARKVNSVKLSGLRKLAALAEKNKITLHQLFNEQKNHLLLLNSLSNLGDKSGARDLFELTSELYHLRIAHPEFELAPTDYSLIEDLSKLAGSYSEYREGMEQTKLVPSRIYGSFIIGFGEELEFFNAHSSSCKVFYAKRSSLELYGQSASRVEFYSRGVSWQDAVAECGLIDLCEKFDIRGVKELNAYINSINYMAKTWIHFFSGMRDNEARTLPADALTSVKVGDDVVTVLRGYTSKTVGQNNIPSYWISSPIVERAVTAAKSIGECAAIRNGWDNSNLSNYPLFPAFNNVKKSAGKYIYDTAPLMTSAQKMLIQKVHSRIPNILVSEADIVELERFDGFRDWRNDAKVKLGEPWPLTSHQCRRSLAVYSARSGIVSLGALGYQYKHLTETMTSFYRTDQVFAENFLSLPDQQAFMRELEYERRVSALMNYNNDVINSSGRLWGGEGNRIQVAIDRGKPLIITTDRAVTARKFEKGEMVYKESPLGGCTNLESCDKIGFISIFACLDCQYSVLDSNKSIKKIRYGISNLHQSRAMFPPTSPFYKQLSSEIETVFSQVHRAGYGHEIEDLK
ncbi:hypothetical protein [Pseudomonas sp.]|uniref:hypothetical protein n=1 Tax=Pseudomonas sp. TaxID=306 RepID=UPI00326488A0